MRPIADTTLAALIEADSEAAFAYARCKAKHAAAVAAYRAAAGRE